MMDQAEKLRNLVQKEKIVKQENKLDSSKPRIITVTSGKGGVGKSNFVVNVAIALQKMGKKVLIFDADMGMGNDDVLMGFLPKFNVYDIIFDNKSIEEVVIEGTLGVKLLPGGTGISKFEEVTEAQRDAFINKLSELNDIDYIIIDTGAGVNRSVLGFIACSEELILITTPEPTSLTDAYSLLKTVNHFKLKDFAKILVNKTMDEEEGKATYNKFSNVVKKFLNVELQYLGHMSEDKKLIKAVRSQEPFLTSYPNSIVAKDVENIAKKIVGIENEKGGKSVQDLFKKIFNIFS
ncbi:chromosome partitioning protein ParA [Clostridium carboxidivorans P7]|uniref:Cobyrinic acid ac-diamide synthase n=1 Tax=Clostridium carboxidivorans P7 TaxID=536227 RepID=C6PPD4_9CLOT|nr:MinD/ParA family protein [Clostridium carboxidivorans]AKN33966.1 chromosome partitioning protein ParA [Clostridium carboxidivorans P7]EET88828.1 Cobyrinic acid ac-diamide synthase [Clostridium carboxidivorans P7]EFG88158.1 CobQ/CobB/MinD/ParA nucleotide binding domain protein [Clostridium carboxidivorans P7]